MMDLNAIPPELLTLRGQYSTVRDAHENAKKQMQVLCSGIGASAAQILRSVQPDNETAPDLSVVLTLIAGCKAALDQADTLTFEIETLAKQREELKPRAWPKPSRGVE